MLTAIFVGGHSSFVDRHIDRAKFVKNDGTIPSEYEDGEIHVGIDGLVLLQGLSSPVVRAPRKPRRITSEQSGAHHSQSDRSVL